MKAMFTAAALGLLAAPALAQDLPALAGVSDQETTISSGGITQYHFGKGDVMFVRDRTDRWYRLELNEGCLKNLGSAGNRISFEQRTPSARIDRFTFVRFDRDNRQCQIESIRASVAPPQADSRSPVTLD